LQELKHLTPTLQEQVLSLIKAAQDFDNTPAIAEHVLLHLRHGGDKADSHLVIQKDNQVIGYAHLDKTDQVAGPSVELVIHPDHRGSGIGSDLLKAAIEVCGNKIRLWSHGDLPQARALAEANNFIKVRTVIQMSKELSEVSPINCNYQIRSFLPGLDNKAWLTLNNLAFANHPEQGNWSEADLSIRLNEDWCDEKGFFVAQDKDQLIGFTWTKIHGGHSHSHVAGEDHHDHAPIGEIYVTAVSDKYAGKGIGKALTITGLNYLKYQGLSSAMLYVDEDNQIAVNLYKSLGFLESGKDVVYKLKSLVINLH
jgi:mycothiol synthase